jgi:hypothetical protein
MSAVAGDVRYIAMGAAPDTHHKDDTQVCFE